MRILLGGVDFQLSIAMVLTYNYDEDRPGKGDIPLIVLKKDSPLNLIFKCGIFFLEVPEL